MVAKRNHDTVEPVCKFGPGGDYVKHYPGDYGKSPFINSLGQLLSRISGILSTAAAGPLQEPIALTPNPKDSSYAVTLEPFSSSDPSSASDSSSDSRSPSQLWLFTNNQRAVENSGHKSKHRVRAYRRIAKKRAAHQDHSQGSLFEANSFSRRTA